MWNKKFSLTMRLLSVWILILWMGGVYGDCDENSYWMRSVDLDPQGIVTIKWNASDNVTMMMIAKTLGWVGIGFSSSGQTKDSDFVMGWIEKDQPHLQDYHFSENGSIAMDQVQSYQPLGGYKNSTHSVVCWTRSLDTCDRQDIKIKNTIIGVLWAWGVKVPTEEPLSLNPVQKDHMLKLNLLNVQNVDSSNLQNVEKFHILIPNITLSNGTNTLEWCFFQKVPKMKTKHHMIGIEPHLQEDGEKIFQCLVLFQCPISLPLEVFQSVNVNGFNCRDPQMKNMTYLCSRMVVTSAGSKAEYLPAQAGFEFGSPQSDTYYFVRTMLQIQPNYTEILNGSGISILHTSSLRENDAGLLFIGSSISPFQIIPPHQPNFVITGICSADCTEKVFPADGIHVFSVTFHSHYAGRKVVLRRYRGGVELQPLKAEHFHFEMQYPLLLKDHLNILPGDVLAVECFYDTSDRNTTTLGGDLLTDEMCLVFLNYYPLVNLSNCFSRLQPQNIYNITGIAVSEDYKETLTKFQHHNWTNEEVDGLQNLNYNSDVDAICLNIDSSPLHLDKNTTRFPTDAKVYKDMEC